MNYTLVSTLAYLALALGMTVYVGNKLRRYGRPFLDEAFAPALHLADSISVLLNVGFYLLNFGIIGLSLMYPLKADNAIAALNVTGYRLGFELLVIGLFHFMNLHFINKARKGERRWREAKLPVTTTGKETP